MNPNIIDLKGKTIDELAPLLEQAQLNLDQANLDFAQLPKKAEVQTKNLNNQLKNIPIQLAKDMDNKNKQISIISLNISAIQAAIADLNQ